MNHADALRQHPQKELIDEILLAAHHGWKPRTDEEDRRIADAWERYARRVTLRYRLAFWWWRIRMDAWAAHYGYSFRYTKATGIECWYEAFEDKVSPRAALLEDWSNA